MVQYYQNPYPPLPPDRNLQVRSKERGNLSRIFLGLLFYLLVDTFVQMALVYFCAYRFPKFYESELFAWILRIVPSFLIAFPLVWLMLSGIKTKKPKKKKLSFQNKVIFLSVSFGFLYLGQILSSFTAELLASFKGEALTSALEEYVVSMSPLMILVVMVILAPVFEEILFRKLVIDRLLPYSERLAVLISGLLFGLVHGNFFQFFYSFFLGIIFGIVYVKTGRIRYTIAMHMIINFSGTLVNDAFDRLINSDGALSNSINPWGVLFDIYSLAQLVLIVVGIILFFLNYKKVTLEKNGEKELSFKSQMQLTFGNTGMILVLVLTGLSFIGSIFI